MMTNKFAQAPLTIHSNAPLELVHQFFVKLGARYVVVTDTEAYCEHFRSPWSPNSKVVTIDEGVIDKKTWLAFLSDLEAKS